MAMDDSEPEVAAGLSPTIRVFVDQDVAEGRAASRADAIAKALAREQRRRAAERDVELLLAHRGEHDLDELAAHAANTPLEID